MQSMHFDHADKIKCNIVPVVHADKIKCNIVRVVDADNIKCKSVRVVHADPDAVGELCSRI